MAVTDGKKFETKDSRARSDVNGPSTKTIRLAQAATLFFLATFVMIGYQNCMGQKVDLDSTTPGASDASASCSPSAVDLTNFSGAESDIQTNCVVCHSDTTNPASAAFRLYSAASGDTTTPTEDFCAVQVMTAPTILGMITTSTIHPFRATTANAPNLLAYLQSL